MQQGFSGLPPPLPLLLSSEQISNLPSWYLPVLSQNIASPLSDITRPGLAQPQMWELSSNALSTLPKGRLPSPTEIHQASKTKQNFEQTLPSGIGTHYNLARELPPSLIPEIPGPAQSLATSIGSLLQKTHAKDAPQFQNSQQYQLEQLARFVGDKSFLRRLDEEANKKISHTQNKFETGRFVRDTRDLIMQEEIEKRALHEKCQYLTKRCYELEDQASRLIQTVDFLGSAGASAKFESGQHMDLAQSNHQALQGLFTLINQYKDEIEQLSRVNAMLKGNATQNFMNSQSQAYPSDPFRLNSVSTFPANQPQDASHYLWIGQQSQVTKPIGQGLRLPAQQSATSPDFLASFGSVLAAQPLQTPAI